LVLWWGVMPPCHAPIAIAATEVEGQVEVNTSP
jgi:hypothetical protein